MEKIIYGIQQIGVGVEALFRVNLKFLITCLIFCFLSVCRVSATEQAPDELIVDGESFSLRPHSLGYPLDSYQVKFTPKMLFGTDEVISVCWRGYVATWSIENDSLFLLKIRNFLYEKGSDEFGPEYADLEKWFSGKYHNGKVFAEWVTQHFFSTPGDVFCLGGMFSSISYKNEIHYVFKNGILQEKRHFERPPYLPMEDEEFKDIVYNRIDWSQIPDLRNKEIQVIVSFSANYNGIVDSVKITDYTDLDYLYQQIVLDAIRGIGVLEVCEKRGRHIRNLYSFSVIFSSENREKYAGINSVKKK